MKDQRKGIVFGFVLALILMCGVNMVLGSGASATNAKKTVSISYKDIKICIDGQMITPKDANGNVVEPFILDGTTYLPVRAVGSTLGKKVDYDVTTRTVYIGQKPTQGLWTVRYYVDKFEQLTDEWFITNSSFFTGTFSNSATTDSELLVQVAVDDHDKQEDGRTRVAFFLFEYGDFKVENYSNSLPDKYNITMRTQDGADYELIGTMLPNTDRIFIDRYYVAPVIAAMKKPGIIHFYIEDALHPRISYRFSLETSNFSDVYAQQMG